MDNASPQNERERLEDELREGLQSAHRAYCEAAAEHTQIQALTQGMLDHPDSASGLHRAVKNERIALQRYRRALKVFSDLVVRGQRPVDPK